MKNKIILVAAALVITSSALAQTDTTTRSQSKTDTAGTPGLTNADANLPEHLKGVTSMTIQPKHFLPVLGGYTSADGAVDVNIMVDEKNVGIVWIEGLPQGRIKGVLKKAPATYKIPAQKTTTGKSVAEGTLIYDADSKQLSLCIGAKFNDADPAVVFTSTKTKSKIWLLNKIENAGGSMQ